jgi:DNA-binding GntR family transcriptional regulator
MNTRSAAVLKISSSTDDSKTERVYQELRRRIRELELQPGSQMRKNDIAEEYGVSRGPVNEAIARLAVEGLVDVFPQSGSFVAPLRLEDVRESLLIRTALEVEVIRRVTQMADDALIEELEQNLEEQAAAVKKVNMARLHDLDEAFHATIMRAVKSPGAERLLDRARAILDRPRFHALPEKGRPRATYVEHARIVDAIRTRDVELAGAAMRVHLTLVAQSIERDIANVITDENSKMQVRE